MADLALREATPDDVAAIVDVFLACWRVSYRGVVPDAVIDRWDRPSAGSLWTGYLSAGSGNRVMAATVEGRIVGMARSSGTAPAVLESLYVHPDASSTGVGSALLRRVLDDASAAGADGVLLWVFETNASARRFYERHGFVADGRRQVEEAFGEPEIGMTLTLGAGTAPGSSRPRGETAG